MFEVAPLREWVAVLRRHRVDRKHALRVVTGLGLSAATLPLRVYEQVRHGRALAATRVHPRPLFILGCARSGTTHLHNLISQDARYGYVTTFQAIAQPFALSGSTWLLPLLLRLGGRKRPMDNVDLELLGPQEEEVAMGSCSRHSALLGLFFPRDYKHFIRRYILDDMPDADREAWKSDFQGVLRKATLACGGKPLALKSPSNTGRVPLLLEMFPDARFVNITRDPYVVFRSLEHAYKKVLPLVQMQEIPWQELGDAIVVGYQAMLQKYLVDRNMIPAGRLVNLRFEDLEADPLGQIERIYDELELGGFQQLRPQLQDYLEKLGPYVKNNHEISDRVVDLVNTHWAFALEALGYERRSVSKAPQLP